MGNSVKDWSGPSARLRQQTRVSGVARSGFYRDGAPNNWGQFLAAGSSSLISDKNHKFHNLLQELRKRNNSQAVRDIDYGDPLAIERVTVSQPAIINRDYPWIGKLNAHYRGYFPPSANYLLDMAALNAGRFPGIPTSLGVDVVDLWSYGSTAIARSLPDVPQFSLFRFLGELREGLPKIPLAVLAKEKKVRNVGGEYINFQFGVAPLTSDVQKFTQLIMNPALRASVKHMLNEEHRVRKVLDKGVTTSTRALTQTEMQVTDTSYTTDVQGTETSRKEYRIWSSVSFAYHQATLLDQLLTDFDERVGGFGIVPKPIDIWNLIGWSWLVDWFVNFNHVITNLSYLGRDGLYLQRGYIMATYSDVLTTRQTRKYMGSYLETTGVRTYERKYRVKASPFGFGYTWKDFSPFQLSILSGLGVSRMRF